MVYVNGPRQGGKSTLVQKLAFKEWPAEYVTFDEATPLGASEANPESFLRAFADIALSILSRSPKQWMSSTDLLTCNEKITILTTTAMLRFWRSVGNLCQS